MQRQQRTKNPRKTEDGKMKEDQDLWGKYKNLIQRPKRTKAHKMKTGSVKKNIWMVAVSLICLFLLIYWKVLYMVGGMALFCTDGGCR